MIAAWEKTLFLREPDLFEVDKSLLQKNVRVLPGRVAVEMCSPPEQLSSFMLPSDVGANLRSDIGVIIAENVGGEVQIGDVVVVRPGDGTWFQDLDLGDYVTDRQLRFYGSYWDMGTAHACPWHDSILAVMAETLQAKGNNLIIRREVQEQGSILLPDSVKQYSPYATVLSVGPLVDGVKAGDRVVYDFNLLYQYGLEIEVGDDYKNCAFCTPLAICCVI